MNLLEKIYQQMSNFGHLFPVIDTNVLYSILLGSLAVLTVIFALCFFATNLYKLNKSSKKISGYLSSVSEITKLNEAEFSSQCFGNSCSKYLSESWQSFLNIRFGFPSEIISASKVFEKERKFSNYPLFLFGAISLIVIALIGIMLSAAVSLEALFVGMLIAFVFAVVLEIVLFCVHRTLEKKALKDFRKMQDDLDAKVLNQNIKEFVADTAGLSQIADELERLAGSKMCVKIPENFEAIVDEKNDISKNVDKGIEATESDLENVKSDFENTKQENIEKIKSNDPENKLEIFENKTEIENTKSNDSENKLEIFENKTEIENTKSNDPENKLEIFENKTEIENTKSNDFENIKAE